MCVVHRCVHSSPVWCKRTECTRVVFPCDPRGMVTGACMVCHTAEDTCVNCECFVHNGPSSAQTSKRPSCLSLYRGVNLIQRYVCMQLYVGGTEVERGSLYISHH